MHTHAEHTSATKSSVNSNASATPVSPTVLPADNRPQATAQRKLVQLAGQSRVVQRVPVVQRMPESDALTEDEEKGIRKAIEQKNYALAVRLLSQTDFYTGYDP